LESTQQTQPNSIADLKPKMRLQGVVKKTQIYGAMVDIGVERDGLVHISQLSSERVNRVTDVVQPGDSVTVWVTSIDRERGRIALTMVKPPDVTWRELAKKQTYDGTVTRLEPYGAFVDIGAERPGLLHVREMSSGYVRHPSELVTIGDEIRVEIDKVDKRRKRIDLTMASPDLEYDDEPEEPSETTMEIALRQAQSQKKQSKRRQGSQRSDLELDLTEQEAILARTIKQHSQHEE